MLSRKRKLPHHLGQEEGSYPVELSGFAQYVEICDCDDHFDKRGVKEVKNCCKSFDANYSCDIVDKDPITREEEDSLGRKVNLRRKEEAAISELSIGTIIVLALLGLSLIACGILCTLKRCGPPAQVST